MSYRFIRFWNYIDSSFFDQSHKDFIVIINKINNKLFLLDPKVIFYINPIFLLINKAFFFITLY